MAGARALWVANGMKREQFGKPIIAIVNSFTQFVPGHTHLHEIGQIVKKEIEAMGCYAAEFNTIAVDDGIAMGHDGMLYSLPSRDVIADSVEYMINAHKADAMICISNCDKVTPGMLMASMRLNIPTVFVSGGPMESHKYKGENADLITAMIKGGDPTVSDEELAEVEQMACPGCGACSGMFTANSMNSLTEALGLSLPGNGSILATHKNRIQLFKDAAKQIVKNAFAYYEDGDDSVLPRSIATSLWVLLQIPYSISLLLLRRQRLISQCLISMHSLVRCHSSANLLLTGRNILFRKRTVQVVFSVSWVSWLRAISLTSLASA